MAELHGEEDGDGGGGLEGSVVGSTPAVVTPAVTILGVAGVDDRPVEMAMNDDFVDLSTNLICADRPSADCVVVSMIETAGSVSNLVGFFSRNNDGQQVHSSTILEEDTNIDHAESQALQNSPTMLEEEIETIEDQHAGAEKNATELNVSVQMNPNTFSNILHSMFLVDADPSPSRKITNPPPLLTKRCTLPYKPRHFPSPFKARRSLPTPASLALTSTQTKSLFFTPITSTSPDPSRPILAVIPPPNQKPDNSRNKHT